MYLKLPIYNFFNLEDILITGINCFKICIHRASVITITVISYETCMRRSKIYPRIRIATYTGQKLQLCMILKSTSPQTLYHSQDPAIACTIHKTL